MNTRIIPTGVMALIAATTFAVSAQAGGFERTGYNIDLLFDPSQAAVEGTTTFVMPQRNFQNTVDTDASDGLGTDGVGGGKSNTRDTSNYFASTIGVKAGLTENIDCLVDYSQPWGVSSKPGSTWLGANSNIETSIKSNNYALTCSYKFDVGPGKLRFIGGAFYQEVSGFKESLVVPPAFATGNGVGRLDLDSHGYGWRTGVAYEIPEYAFRASLVYNSSVNLDNITGTLDLSQVNGAVYDVYGETKMPDSLELAVQSGIAPDWLAFGSVKWTDWSQLQSIPFYIKGTTAQITSLDLLYQDGWTITGGVGHKFNDQWSGAVSVTWDRGTSHGYGSQTDTWLFGTGVSYEPNKHVEIKLSGAIGWMESGSSGPMTYNGTVYGSDVSYDFGADMVAAVSTSLKLKF